jgi:hypothetical protein
MTERPPRRGHRENTMAHSYYNKLSVRFALMGILLAGFGLRAYYAHVSHPFEDEFVSMLASQAVQRSFLPILPSGLFYTKGLPYSIINALYIGLVQSAGNGSLPEALLFPYRLPSVLIGMLCIALIYRIGRDWFSPLSGLIAAGLLAISPLGVIWGARVRMYGLAMGLTLLLLYALSKMVGPANTRRWRGAMLVILIVALLNHPLTVLLAPSLLIIAALWAWNTNLLARRHSWFKNTRALAVWGFAIAAGLVGSILYVFSWIYAEYGGVYEKTGSFIADLAPKVHFSLSPGSTSKFLAGFVWENTFNLPLFAVAFGGGLSFLLLWIVPRWRRAIDSKQRWGVFSLLLLSTGPFIVLLSHWRADRYWTPFLPLVFLLAGLVAEVAVRYLGKLTSASLPVEERWTTALLALTAVAVLGGVGRSEISNLFYDTPPAYEQALSFVKQHWQSGDVIVIPFPAASGMYLGRTDYFAADVEAEIKLLKKGTTVVDRWWGAPWIERGRQLQDLLQKHTRVWFLADEEHYKAFFRGDWHFVEQHNMKLAWAQDNAMVYVSGQPGIALPDKPEHELNANLSDVVSLQGYTSSITGSAYRVFLFWKSLSPTRYDFTQFVHIRDQAGKTVAQADFQPLNGEYPTRFWRPGEVVVDVVDIPIPPGIAAGEYRVLAGLYRWDTLERLPVTADATGENAVELERVQVGGQAAK